MVDKRIEKTARTIVEYSTKVKKGDRVIITSTPNATPLVLEIYKLCLQKNAYPVIRTILPGANYIFFKYAKDHHLKRMPKTAMYEIKNTDVYIAISGSHNTREFSNISAKKIALRSKTMSPVSRYRSNKTRWVIFDYPTSALAQEAGMSVNEYEHFVFNAVDHNWSKLTKRLKKLASIVNKANHVRIIGPGTDLNFTIKKTRCVVGDGSCNLPGGEIYTAPDKFSVEGHIKFSYPSIRRGNVVRGIYLEFHKGKVIKATADTNQDFLQEMINIDSGASYIGEFGIGCNYKIKQYTNNTLFDEKIGGTVHFALGNAYTECKGKNKSVLHWDIVKDLRKKGSIFLDGKLFQKNGKFKF